MKVHRLLLVLTIQIAVAAPAPAGIFSGLFKKRQQRSQPPQQSTNPYQNQNQPSNPYSNRMTSPYSQQQTTSQHHGQAAPSAAGDQVSQLINIAKTDPSESRRTAAVKELRNVDARTHPQVLAILIDVLQNDADSGVRAAAAEALGRLRPLSQQAGWALQKATNDDSSVRVRWQARAALIQYQMNGYQPRQPNQAPPGMPTTAEPPLAEPITATPAPEAPRPTPPPPSYIRQPNPPTVEPPVAPVSTPKPPLVPAEPPRLQRPPSEYDEGPILTFPK